MGFVRQAAAKLTGADVQADAMERSAEQQAQAVKQAAELSAKTAQEGAAQAARLQESSAARNAAQSAAAETMSKPLENADVQLGAKDTGSAVGAVRKRRASFGVGVPSNGVNI